MNETNVRPANFTRRTKNLAGKLRGEHRYVSLALYHILRLSDLGREGIERSGSYRFADHIYVDRASGKGVIGRILDRILLNLPATRAMRQRCVQSTAAMRQAWNEHCIRGHAAPFRLMTIPCGIPRDVRDFSDAIIASGPGTVARIEYTGLDLDPEVLAVAEDFLLHSILPSPRWIAGDALNPDSYPKESFHCVASTGLGEFLDDSQLLRFYANVHACLLPGGVFFTSATASEPRSDAMLRAFELHTHYRSSAELEKLVTTLPWREVQYTRDASGLQTFVRAVKG